MAEDKLARLRRLNEHLNPPEQLGGVFLPKGSKERFDFMFVAEMPAMKAHEDIQSERNFNFSVTARDRFLQDMIAKYGAAGSYVTDIVKSRAEPGLPARGEIIRWLPHLLEEIRIIEPKAIVVLGRRTFEKSFKPYVQSHVPRDIKVCWVFHYSSQVSRQKFEVKFSEVMGCLRKLQEPS